MYTTFVILALLLLTVLFAKVYHSWMASRPIMFTFLIGTVTFTGVLLGNTVFTDSFFIPALYQWATVDAMADGPLGASGGVFLLNMAGFALLASVAFGAIAKFGSKFMQSAYVYIPFVLLIFCTFTAIAAPVGIHFNALGIDVMSPTKEVAGKLASATLNAGASGIVATAIQLEGVIQESDSYNPADFEPAVEQRERSDDRLDSSDQNKKEEESTKKKPLRRYGSHNDKKGPPGQ